jgi:hypothetical protein
MGIFQDMKSRTQDQWLPLAIHFRQRYEQGYLYLDNCGAFLLDCENTLGLVSAEVKVTGAKLEKPEMGVSVTVDTSEVKAAQENPEDGGAEFAELCAELGELVQKHFPPALVHSNGFAWRCFRPFHSPDSVKEASLAFGGTVQADLGKVIGMVPSHANTFQVFVSGSRELTVQLAPITFEKVTVQRQTAPLGASEREKRLVDRHNLRADRISSPPPYGLSLSVDLVEKDPPVKSIPDHFAELGRYRELVMKEFS